MYQPFPTNIDFDQVVEGADFWSLPTYEARQYPTLIPRAAIKTVILGGRDEGSHSFFVKRTKALDSLETTVSWRLDRDTGVITVSFVSDYQGPYYMYDSSNMAPIKRLEYKNTKGHFEWEGSVRVSNALREALATGRPNWDSSDNFHDIRGTRSEATLYYTRYGRREYVRNHEACGLNMYLQYHIGTLPTDAYVPRSWVNGLLMDSLLESCQETMDWEMGGQYVPYGSDTESYQFGRKGGKDRGGVTIYSQLQEQGISNNRYYDGNLWMLVQDIGNLFEDFKTLKAAGVEDVYQLWRFLKRKGSLKDAAKAAANTYLPLKYGYKLTLEDCFAWKDGMDRLFEDLKAAKEGCYLGPERAVEDVSHSPFLPSFVGRQIFCWQATVLPEPNWFSGLFSFLDRTSLNLSMNDAWDWIPYSFVVNWFTSLPKRFVDHLDFKAWEANYFLLEACRSYKMKGIVSAECAISATSGLLSPHDTVNISFYHRNWSRAFDPPISYRRGGFDPQVPLRHWTELGALIIQRA
jgi:hypothetical protein